MCRTAQWVSIAALPLLLAACGLLPGGGGAQPVEQVLPTATPEPVIDTPMPTETPPPPPTVTPFPTVTPEGSVPLELPGSETPPTVDTTGGGGTNGSTSAPVAGIPADVPVGQRLYLADFTSGTWYTEESDTVKVEPAFGGYLWQIGPVETFWLNTNHPAIVDLLNYYAQIKVDVQRCPQGAAYGWRFRMTDLENFYQYAIWCNDTYSFFSKIENVQGPFIPKTELPPTLAGSPEGQRVIGLLTRGSSYTLYLDGVKVADFEETELTTGDIALFAQAGDNAVRLVFDDWEVYELK